MNEKIFPIYTLISFKKHLAFSFVSWKVRQNGLNRDRRKYTRPPGGEIIPDRRRVGVKLDMAA